MCLFIIIIAIIVCVRWFPKWVSCIWGPTGHEGPQEVHGNPARGLQPDTRRSANEPGALPRRHRTQWAWNYPDASAHCVKNTAGDSAKSFPLAEIEKASQHQNLLPTHFCQCATSPHTTALLQKQHEWALACMYCWFVHVCSDFQGHWSSMSILEQFSTTF